MGLKEMIEENGGFPIELETDIGGVRVNLDYDEFLKHLWKTKKGLVYDQDNGYMYLLPADQYLANKH